MGYYASFKIGAEWIDKQEALVVTAKRGMEKIDFLRMFMTCFCSDLAVDSFSQIYSIDLEKPAIVAPALSSVVSPLIVFHFIGVVNRIKSLRKGYVQRQENLKKVKGHIKMLKTNASISPQTIRPYLLRIRWLLSRYSREQTVKESPCLLSEICRQDKS